MSRIKTAVILAAGMGSRLYEVTDDSIPKGFLRVNGKTLIERSIEKLRSIGIEKIYIVTGHLHEHYDKLAEKYNYIETRRNRRYRTTGSMTSLSILENELKEDFDYVLIDCPAGIEQGFENSVVGADRAVVVVNPEITSVRDADRVIGKLDAKGLDDHAVIINRLNYEMTQRGDMLDVSDIIETLSIELLGVVPDDKNITVSTNKGEPIVLDDKSISGQAFKNIARRITGEEVPLLDLKTGGEGFFASIKRLFKR